MANRVLCGTLFLLASFSLSAQHISVVDSLKNVLRISNNEKNRVDVLIMLTDELWHSAPTQAILYSDSALQIAKTIDYPKGLGLALANKGVAYYTLGNYQEASKCYEKSLATYSEKRFSYSVNAFYINLLRKQGRYLELIDFVNSVLQESDISSIEPIYLLNLIRTFVELGNIKESEKYIHSILESTNYSNEQLFYAEANGVLFEYLMLKSDYDSAENLLLPVFDIYISLDDNLALAKANIQLGTLKMATGKVKEARNLLSTALVLYDSSGYLFGIAEAKRSLGTFYSLIEENSIATEYLFDAEEIYENQNNLNELAKTYNELSWIYIQQGSYETAKNFIFKAIELGKKTGNKVTESLAFNIYGTLLYESDSMVASFEAYKKAYAISLKVGNKQRIAATLYNMTGLMEIVNPNNPEILANYLAAYELEKEIGNNLGIAISERTLGSYYINSNELELAEHYLNISRVKLVSLNSKSELLENYRFSAELYEKQKRYKLANDYHKLYISLQATLNNEAVMNRLGELEIKYDVKNKEREIEILNLENKSSDQELKLQEKKISNQRLLIGAVVFAVAFLLLLLLSTYRMMIIRSRNTKKLQLLYGHNQEQNEEIMAQSEELQEANQQIVTMNEALETTVETRTNELQKAYNELDTFFYRASHDFTGPLTTFRGITELAKVTLSDTNALHLFDKVEVTAIKMDKMVRKLRHIRLVGAVDLKIETIDFENIINRIVDRNLDYIHNYNYKINKEINVTKGYNSIAEIIEFIFESILENSFEYNSSKQPNIKIEIKSKASSGVFILFEDNGDGIQDQHLSKVFEMFYRASDKAKGNGLGLYLVKKGVSRLKGDVKIDSVYGKGTKIIIELPEIITG